MLMVNEMYEIMSECNEWVLRNEMRNYNGAFITSDICI